MKKTFPEITRDQIRLYAEASGDFNPIHLDPEFAKAAGLPDIIAHGMLSMGLLGESLRDLGIETPQLKSFTTKFKSTAKVGTVLTANVVAGSIEAKKLELALTNQTGDEICSATVELK